MSFLRPNRIGSILGLTDSWVVFGLSALCAAEARTRRASIGPKNEINGSPIQVLWFQSALVIPI